MPNRFLGFQVMETRKLIVTVGKIYSYEIKSYLGRHFNLCLISFCRTHSKRSMNLELSLK